MDTHKVKDIRGQVIILEGLLGVGKSTACRDLAAHLNAHNVPTKVFVEPNEDDLIGLMLSNIKKNAYAYQMYRLFQRQAIRIVAQTWAQEGYCCIIDGSMLSAYCFALFHKNRGNFGELHEERYNSFITTFEAIKFDPPSHTIFLSASPEIARDRCYRRRTSEAKMIQLEFFEQLSTTYDQLLSKKNLAPNLTRLDWNPDKNIKERIETLLSELNFENYSTFNHKI